MLIIIIIIIISSIILLIKNINRFNKLDLTFYNYKEVYPELETIKNDYIQIKKEVENLNNDWIPWPEKYLYTNDNWTIYPLYVFNKYSKHINKLPTLYKFLNTIKGLKIASLSKMKPKTKLIPHKGWGNHSNHVLRCHYGIIVEKNKCYISVKDVNKEFIEYQKENEWLVFDDSKEHYAENTSDKDRIVLILDIERPEYIKKGNSKVEYSEEFNNIIEEFNKNY